MLFGKLSKWNISLKKLKSKEISIQEFVNANKNKTLYYSTPFFENEKGRFPNVMQTKESDTMFFPAFSSVSDLESYMAAIGCAQHIVIKGDLKSVLDSLDSHQILKTWGVVIDPRTSNSIGIPPNIRVQPNHLR